MAFGDIIKICDYCSAEDQVAVNVNYFVQTSPLPNLPINQDVLRQCVNEHSVNAGPAYRECLPGIARFEGTIGYYPFKRILGDPAPFVASTGSYAGLGTSGLTGLAPTQACGLIRKKGPQAGRHFRGRMYVPFPPLEAIDPLDDLAVEAYKTVLLDLASVFNNGIDFVLGNGDPIVMEWCLVNQLLPINQNAPIIVGYSVGNGFATQRRRSYYGKKNIVPSF